MNRSAHQQLIKDAGKQRQRQLEQNRERFQQKSTRQTPRIDHHTPIHTTDDLQREKRLRKRAQKELHKARKKLDEQQQTIQETNRALKKRNRQVAELKTQRWEHLQSRKEAENLKDRIAELGSHVQRERTERQKAEETIRQMEAELEKKLKRNRRMSAHTNRVKHLKQENAALRRKVENYDLLTRQKYGNLEREVRTLRNEVSIHRRREREVDQNPMHLIAYMKQHVTSDYLPDLLEMTEAFIKSENLPFFYRGSHNLFYLFMRRVNLLSYQSRDRDTSYLLKNTQNTNATTRLGFLVYDQEGWQFTDVSETSRHQVYPVTNNVSGSHLTEDRPAKAILNHDGAKVLQQFSMNTPETSQPKGKPSTTNHPKKQYQHFGQFSVLVIGSRFLNHYKYRLEKHGCVTDIHNPYEESFEVLRGRVGRAEIILVCERHIPHNVWDYVDKTQPFVSVLKRDSKDLIAAHAYLTLKRCELL